MSGVCFHFFTFNVVAATVLVVTRQHLGYRNRGKGSTRRYLISVRASLLGAMLTLVFLIALALLITMQINAARLVRDLSETVFGARAAQVQAQLSAYFEPVVVALEAMGSTIRNGRLDPLEPGEMTRYSAGLVAVADQICAVSACDTAGNMYSLEYRDGLWVTRYQAPSSWPGKVRLERFSDPSQPAVARWWEQAAGDPRASHWYQGAEKIAILGGNLQKLLRIA